MYAIFFDTSSAQNTVLQMQNNLHEFAHGDMRDELVTWQVEDMHRHFPNVDTDQEYVSWFTLIWPRSRTYDNKKIVGFVGKGVYRRHRKPLSPRPRTVGRTVKGGSHRPILRPALFNRLVLRMSDLLGSSLSWTRAKHGGGPPGGGGGPSGGVAAGQARIAALGHEAARRIQNLPSRQPQPTRVTTPYQPGPRERRRMAAAREAPPTKVATPAKPGPQTLKRWSVLRGEGVTRVSTRSQPGPLTRARWSRLFPGGKPPGYKG